MTPKELMLMLMRRMEQQGDSTAERKKRADAEAMDELMKKLISEREELATKYPEDPQAAKIEEAMKRLEQVTSIGGECE